jgi:hypothetical protein
MTWYPVHTLQVMIVLPRNLLTRLPHLHLASNDKVTFPCLYVHSPRHPPAHAEATLVTVVDGHDEVPIPHESALLPCN